VQGEFDAEILADRTIEVLAVAAGQVMWIWAGTHSLDLIQALAFRIRERGAFWALRLTIEPLLRRIGQEVPASYLALIPEHELRWLADIDAVIEIRDQAGGVGDVPLARARAMAAEWIALIDEASRRGCRRVSVLNPTPALAHAYGMSLADLREVCERAVNIDYRALDRCQERVRSRLAETREVHVTSSLGTDLRLRVDQRPVHVDQDSIPRGEVYVAPHEDSANGIAVIDRAFIGRNPVERLQLTFVRGRVVDVRAPDDGGVDSFWELMSASDGDKDVIAEFGIGLNPGITEAVGETMLDEKIGGSVHIAIGMNESFGGRNRSNLHLDLVMRHPTVGLDGSQIIADGTLAPDIPGGLEEVE